MYEVKTIVTTIFQENHLSDSPDADLVPLVSVIILAYGNRDFVDACLEAVSRQTWGRMEVLFVDNNSRDDSADVARAAFERLNLPGEVIALDENLGCAGGNNVGW